MKKLTFILIATLSLSLAVFAQTNPPAQNNSSTTAETKKKPPVFRAKKEQP